MRNMNSISSNILFLVFVSVMLLFMHPSQSVDSEMVRAQVADQLMDGNLGSQDRILGELIYEAKGKIVGQRVADIGNSNNDDHDGLAKVEVSYSGKGYIKGVGNVSETWTFVNTHLLNGTTQGAGKGIITSDAENGIVTATELCCTSNKRSCGSNRPNLFNIPFFHVT
jgi:hypothetical protein